MVAVGWVANTAGLDLAAAGVHTDQRGYVQVDSELRTSAPHIFAAGDVTGHLMVVHEAVREGYLAATNAVLGSTTALAAEVSPIGSFTDPEYASVGLTEAAARADARGDRGDRALRLAATTDNRRPARRLLQADRRPTAPHHPRLPHRRRACGRARTARGDRDGLPG